MKNEKIKVRINVNRSLWAEIKAKATRENKKAEDTAAELMDLGLLTRQKTGG